jgi:hypothetical protein
MQIKRFDARRKTLDLYRDLPFQGLRELLLKSAIDLPDDVLKHPCTTRRTDGDISFIGLEIRAMQMQGMEQSLLLKH